MKNIIKASLFKLFKDLTFRVTLIVGLALAVLLSLLYMVINLNTSGPSVIGNGGYMLLTSFTPSQNFGLAIPINLIILIVGEFTYGTIRNKVIVGYRKSYIYFSLFLIGLIFTFFLLTAYTALSVALGCLLNGGWGNLILGADIGKYILVSFCGYIFVCSLSIMLGTAIRNQGAAIGLTVLILVVCMIATLTVLSSNNGNMNAVKAAFWLIPLFSESMTTIGGVIAPNIVTEVLSGELLAASIVSPLIYGAICYLIGNFAFNHSDLK